MGRLTTDRRESSTKSRKYVSRHLHRVSAEGRKWRLVKDELVQRLLLPGYKASHLAAKDGACSPQPPLGLGPLSSA